RMKKVICHCGKVIKLGCRYDETFLNIHVDSKGCLAKQGVRSILNYFKPAPKSKKIKMMIVLASEVLSDDDMIISSNNKWKPCSGLRSSIIRKYISCTPA
ncbi:20566_t:CDS:2, partial [Gigaspora rosea]